MLSTSGLASAWEAGADITKARREVSIFVIALIAVLLFGGGRLAFFPPRSQTIRVASITGPNPDALPNQEYFSKLSHRLFAGDPISDAGLDLARQRAEYITSVLLTRADLEAQAGAQLITFGEGEFPVLKQDEDKLITRCADLARARHIFLGLPLATLNVGHRPAVEDELVLVTPSGEVAWAYLKAQLVPGFEMREFVKSAGLLPLATTPYGRLGGAIAFDMDFTNLLLQAGKNHTDLMIVPGIDSKEIDPLHSHMAAFRAIEEGFNLVLHTSLGLSLAIDYQGSTFAMMDQFRTVDHMMVAQVPTTGTTTVYSWIGYVFPLICILGFSSIVISTLLRGDRLESQLDPTLN